ncbi:MAG: pimeloyl-ACP methyl ester carboxylesterase [Planctomycetota bacterium]|jgi:pimeloyl-ACP methyl ester carboxylesterase
MPNVLLFSVLGIVAAGVGFERLSRLRDRKQFPPPDLREDIGGHRLHFRLRADGGTAEGPVVVFEADAADWSTHWGSIPGEIARDAAVLTYDRAGLGWSEPGPGPRTGETLARELHSLIMRVAPDRKILMVAHGAGAHLARIFAHRYPFETAGLVLIDPEHERFDDLLRQRSMPLASTPTLFLRAILVANSLGLLRLFKIKPSLPDLENLVLQPRQRAALMARGYEPQVLMTLLAEELARPATLAQVAELKDRFEFPVRVLSAGATMNPGSAPRDFPVDEFNRLWIEQAGELLSLSSDAHQDVVEASHHHVALHSPERVADAIRDALADVAASSAEDS